MSILSCSRSLLLLAAPALVTGAASAQFVDVAAGYDHSLALGCDGTVVAWGGNSSGQCDVPALPPGLTYVGISAGGAPSTSSIDGLSLALRSDGSVVAWGNNTYGQLNVPPLPPGLTYVEVAAGPHHALARRSDGTVMAWGENGWGVCNVPALPPGLSYVQIAARCAAATDYSNASSPDIYTNSYSVGLRSDGSVVVWGFPHHGVTNVPALPPGQTYVKIAAGSAHIAARVSDGSVVAWGANDTLPPPFGGMHVTEVPPLPPGLMCVDVAAGGAYSAALLNDGSILSWGNQLPPSPTLPAPPAGATYQALAVGGDRTHSFGQTIDETSGFHHVIALRSDGSLQGWGHNFSGQASVPAGWSFGDLGLGLAGTMGVPQLTGRLDCPTGSGQPVTLTLQGAPPSSPSFLVVGRQRIDLPKLGGTLVPSPNLILRGQTDPTGAQTWSRLAPLGLPTGSVFYAQLWVRDPGAPSGGAASNAIVLEAP